MNKALKARFRATWPHLKLRFRADGAVLAQQGQGRPFGVLLTDRQRRETCAAWAGAAARQGEWDHPALTPVGPLAVDRADRRRQIQDFYGVLTQPRD